ncbi:MAG: hypothetical protein ABIH66_09775 [bacterium]
MGSHKSYVNVNLCTRFKYEEDDKPMPTNDPVAELPDIDEIGEDEWSELRMEREREYENEPPTDEEILNQNKYFIQQQRNFQLAAECVAAALAGFSEVEKVVLFGSVATPLKKEIPRFKKFHRHGVAVYHECKDIDMAVWVSNLGQLNFLRKASARALTDLLREKDIGVASHQVDIFIMEPGTARYLGRLCNYAQCPKGKPKCHVPGCGDTPYLKQHEDFNFDDKKSFTPENSVILFQR